MDEIDRPRRPGDAASLLATEPLDTLSRHELDERIALLEAEITRVRAHGTRVLSRQAAADALFGSGPPPGRA